MMTGLCHDCGFRYVLGRVQKEVHPNLIRADVVNMNTVISKGVDHQQI